MSETREVVKKELIKGAIVLAVSLLIIYAQTALHEGGGNGPIHRVRWVIAEHERRQREEREFQRDLSHMFFEAYCLLEEAAA